jgi:hypothetical protein
VDEVSIHSAHWTHWTSPDDRAARSGRRRRGASVVSRGRTGRIAGRWRGSAVGHSKSQRVHVIYIYRASILQDRNAAMALQRIDNRFVHHRDALDDAAVPRRTVCGDETADLHHAGDPRPRRRACVVDRAGGKRRRARHGWIERRDRGIRIAGRYGCEARGSFRARPTGRSAPIRRMWRRGGGRLGLRPPWGRGVTRTRKPDHDPSRARACPIASRRYQPRIPRSHKAAVAGFWRHRGRSRCHRTRRNPTAVRRSADLDPRREAPDRRKDAPDPRRGDPDASKNDPDARNDDQDAPKDNPGL